MYTNLLLRLSFSLLFITFVFKKWDVPLCYNKKKPNNIKVYVLHQGIPEIYHSVLILGCSNYWLGHTL